MWRHVTNCFQIFPLILFSALTALAGVQEPPPLDLHSIPISDWLNAGDHAEIPWNFSIREPYLRIDQRLEVLYVVRISGKELNRSGKNHELFLVSRISTPDGEWLNEPNIIRHTVESEIPNNVRAEFQMHVVVQPGEYTLWAVLYDRKTG